MSIVALARKTQALYGNHGKGHDGFSINATARFIGPGPTSLGRSATRTPFKGTSPVGHGSGPVCRVSGNSARVCGYMQYPRHILCVRRPADVGVKKTVQNYHVYMRRGLWLKQFASPPPYTARDVTEAYAAQTLVCDDDPTARVKACISLPPRVGFDPICR